MSFVILSPPKGIVFVYMNAFPSNTPISVFPAPISNSITLSSNSLVSNIRFLSANAVGTIPSISIPTRLNMVDNCLTYSLSAKIICAFNVKFELKFPTGSVTTFPLSSTICDGTMSIIVFPSGISMSLACIIALWTSFNAIPANLSFNSFTMLFWTIVTYFPGIVTYAELILKSASSSASFIVFAMLKLISSSLIILPFFKPEHFSDVLHIVSICPKLFTSPTTVQTLDVPISIPIMISPIAKIIPPFILCFTSVIYITF